MARVDCGVYKITSPSNKVYIGQSTSVKRRFKQYQSNHSSNKFQRKLFNSFQKYGVENHIFEVIEYVDISMLYVRERFWQEFYNVLDKNLGLNLLLTKTDMLPCKMSEETKLKISASLKGKNLGKISSVEHRAKISKANTGYVMPQSQKDSISKTMKFKGSKKLIDTVTKEVYLSIGDAASKLSIKYGTLRAMINGQNMNKTNLRVYE